MKKTKEDFPNLSTAIDSLLEDDVNVEGKLAKIGELLIKNYEIKIDVDHKLAPAWVEAYYGKRGSDYIDPNADGVISSGNEYILKKDGPKKKRCQKIAFGGLRFAYTTDKTSNSSDCHRQRVDIVLSADDDNYDLSFLIKGAFRLINKNEEGYLSQEDVAKELWNQTKGQREETYLVRRDDGKGPGEIKFISRVFAGLKKNIDDLLEKGLGSTKTKYKIKPGLGVLRIPEKKTNN